MFGRKEIGGRYKNTQNFIIENASGCFFRKHGRPFFTENVVGHFLPETFVAPEIFC